MKQKQYCNKFDEDFKIKKKWADHGFMRHQARSHRDRQVERMGKAHTESSLLKLLDTRRQNLGPEATRYQRAEPRSSLEVERSRKDDAETEPGVCL